MHFAIVEVIAHQAPRLDEHLSPFLARVQGKRPTFQINGLFQFGRRRRAGLDDVKLVRFLNENLLPVLGEFVTFDLFSEGFGFRIFIGDLQSHQVGLARRSGPERDPIQLFGVDSQLAVIARWNRHRHQPVLKTFQIDHNLGRLIGFPSLVRALFGLFLCLIGFVFGLGRFWGRRFICLFLFFVAGMQFIGRLERGATVFDQRNQIHVDWFIEERFGLTRPPGALDQRFQSPFGKEIDPSAIRAPGRAVAVDAIAGQGGRDGSADLIQPNLAVEVLRRRREG